MATGIEHRGIDTILQSYDYNEDLPNWAIYANKDQRAYYNAGNKDQGALKLQELLQMIEAANTQTVYTLRMYPEGVTEIKSSTPHHASTTFMLNAAAPVTRDANGLMVIDQTKNSNNASLQAQVLNLQAQLENEREARHKAELHNLEQRFAAQIAGLTSAQEEKSWFDRIIGVVETNPEVLDKVMQPVERFLTGILNIFDKRGANTPPPNFVPVNGTDAPDPEPTPQPQPQQNTEDMAKETTAPAENIELTEEQLDALHDQQDIYIEQIEDRLGPIILTQMLEKVAGMDDKNLKMLLSFL